MHVGCSTSCIYIYLRRGGEAWSGRERETSSMEWFANMGLPNYIPASDTVANLGFAFVSVSIASALAASAYVYCTKKPADCLDPENFKEFKLIKRTKISPDTAKFRFALPTPASVLGLPVGQHIRCRGKDSQGDEVIRPYTPITLDSDVGYFELVVKMYPQGRMSHHFRQMSEGDYLAVKGPVGKLNYKPGQVRAFGMLAGGTGITPMFQVTRAILENPKDKTNVYLVYANQTVEDILLKEELDGFAAKYPNRFKVYYVVSQAPSSEPWNGGVGHISKKMIQYHCPPAGPKIQILRCGPPPMNKAMAAHLDELGYTAEMQFKF